MMTPTDRAAFERAIEMARWRDPATRNQINEMLQERSWLDAARQCFCTMRVSVCPRFCATTINGTPFITLSEA